MTASDGATVGDQQPPDLHKGSEADDNYIGDGCHGILGAHTERPR
jgi:hypothetical protein